MYRIEGRVLIKETYAGIPDLLVVFYDLDRSKDKAEQLSHFQPSTGKSKNQPEFFWEQLPGDRLGSVITGPQGEFKLEFDENQLHATTQELKPDLIMFVLAPEEPTDGKSGFPMQVPTTERILHFSREPVMASGLQESFLVRIPKARLDALQIAYPTSMVELLDQNGASPRGKTKKLTKKQVASEIKESNSLKTGLKDALITQLRKNVQPTLDLKRTTDKTFQNFSLSSLPKAMRSRPTYLSPDDDLDEIQKQVVSSALEDIPKLDQAAGVKRKLRLALTEDRLQEFGLTPDGRGVVSGEISTSSLLMYTRTASNSTELEYSSPILAECKRLDAERLFRDALNRCEVSTEPTESGVDLNEEPEASEITTDVFIQGQLERQMKHVTAPEVELKYGVEREGEITATITKPGPADVTSYHDFYELQIAFDYIWKEAFDGTLTDVMKEAYAEMVRYSNQVSGVPHEYIEFLNKPIESVDDMRQLYEDFRLLQNMIANSNRETDSGTTDTPLQFVPSKVKSLLPQIDDSDWTAMQLSDQEALLRLANEYSDAETQKNIAIGAAPFTLGTSLAVVPELDNTMSQKREDARRILDNARARRRDGSSSTSTPTPSPHGGSSRIQELMTELDQRLSERYKFDIFAPDSTNYGIMLTYRQAWTPQDYQVGDLVSTIPLAPKEVRRYSKKRVVKKSRMQKELEDAQSSRRLESSSTARADAEIVKTASNKTSFEQTAEGTLNIGVFEGRFGTRFGIDAEKASSSTKKNFREAVMKAAEEYNQQHRLEVETSTSEEFEFTDSGEISNPNDEITVTYLFYELQRQYQVRERIHRLTPVILVANEIPEPHEIDEDWLLAHHWILRRVILDDVYLPALDYVTTSFAGDEMSLEVMWTNLQRQANLVDELTRQVQKKVEISDNAFNELRRITNLIREKGDIDKLKDINLAAAFGPFAIAGMLGDDDQAAEKREEIAKLAIERADKDVQQVNAKLSREVTALQAAIDKYTAALREHLDRQMAVTALRIHIKENILCYMHAIWDHECGDERYFRLYNIDVPWVEIEEHTTPITTRKPSGLAGALHGGTDLIHLEGELNLKFAKITSRKLSQVADLDNLIGYKGNYMIFPVKEPNHLHWYMMQDYIDPATGDLRDPDEFASYDSGELFDYACCLRDSGVDESDERMTSILELLEDRTASTRRESELIVVPTDSLYIEALPGKHPVLEDFKLVHRAIDVKKVQSELRHDELENIRLAARLLEDEREDPEIDKKVLIQGSNNDIVVPTDS
jgi:hypothetical protein